MSSWKKARNCCLVRRCFLSSIPIPPALRPGVLASVLALAIQKNLGGKVYADELGLKGISDDIVLPAGRSAGGSLEYEGAL